MDKDMIPSIPQVLISLAGIAFYRFITSKHMFINYLQQLQLRFYQVPTDNELKILRQDPKKYEQYHRSPHKHRPRHGSSLRLTPPNSHETIRLQNKSLLHLRLDQQELTTYDILSQPLAVEAESLMAVWVSSTMVYFMTEFYIGLSGYKGINYSIFWLLLALCDGFYQLWRLLPYNMHFWNQALSTYLTIALVSGMQLINTLVVVRLGEHMVELGLDPSIEAIMGKKIGATPGALVFAEMFKLVLAILTAVLTGLYILNGWRVGGVHKNLLGEPFAAREYLQILHAHSHAFIILALYFKPMTRPVAQYFGMTDSTFNSIKVIYIMAALIAKAYTLPHYLRMYLEMARRRVAKIAVDDGGQGHTTNHQLAGSISEYAVTINMFIIQFMTPILISFSMVALYKSTIAFRWIPIFSSSPPTPTAEPIIRGHLLSLFKMVLGRDTSKVVDLLNAHVLRGILSTGVFFSTFSWLASSIIGILNAVANGP